MSFFQYQNESLCAETADLATMADAVGTPFYCYSTAAIVSSYNRLSQAFSGLDVLICYAMKANSNQAVLKILARLGAGADIVSEGELHRVMAAGYAAGRVMFSGVGKTEREIKLALETGIACFNVESEPELAKLSQIAVATGRTAQIALRVNPDVDARTHAKISTGKAENKFGIPLSRARDVYNSARQLPGIAVHGVDMHIGSQITDLSAFDNAFALLADFVRVLRSDGHVIDHIDPGGGLGISYQADDNAELYSPERYAAIIRKHLGGLDCRLILEPGRFLVGNAGVLVTRVIQVKQGGAKAFVVVDAAMNDLVRPTLYEAYHQIIPVASPAGSEKIVADVVGPVCETGDYLALNRSMPMVAEGDLLAVLSAGAYGAVHAGTYNSRLLIPEVLVDGARFAVIRERKTYDDLIALDTVPDWLS